MPKNKQPGILFGFFIGLLGLGSIALFLAGEDYYRYIFHTLDAASAIAPLNKQSELEISRPASIAYDTEVKYRKFFITFPGANKVELAADFNRWGKDPIELKGYRKGYFETSVALTGGEYKYVFVVDGKDVLDPSNKDRTTFNGRAVCIKTVR